jgi:hypothetical protein
MIFVQFKELENWHNNMFSDLFKCFFYHGSRILRGTITEEMMVKIDQVLSSILTLKPTVITNDDILSELG